MKCRSMFIFSIWINFCFSQQELNWTIMHYSAGSNSSEVDLMSDIEEMKRGKISKDFNLITLIDRTEGFSEDSIALGENFSDTRLYEIGNNSFIQLDGKEFFPGIAKGKSFDANMGDVQVLKRFIQYCKKYYPAKNYMLVLRSHGNGVAMCGDAEDGSMDRIYPGEMQSVLSEGESVDILGLDVCSMAGLENLYEWRPGERRFSADFVIASAPLSGAWAYDAILSRITSRPGEEEETQQNYFDGGVENNLDPATMSPQDFSKLIIEEVYDNQKWASWGLFDNTKIEVVKQKIDEASILLAEESKEVVEDIISNTLGYYHNTSGDIEISQLTFPYIDAYHFWDQISSQPNVAIKVREKASEVCNSIDEVVIASYYGRGYLPETDHFTDGKNGIYQVIPNGSEIFSQSKRTFWSHCGWYHPDDKSDEDNSFGQYDWCRDGAVRGNSKVESFFELLDFLFDESNDETGGVNNYQW